MSQFAIRYLFIALFLFAIIENPNVVSNFINNIQNDLIVFLITLFIDTDFINGNIVRINKTYQILIDTACNGLLPITALFAAIISYTAPIVYKIKWLFYAYIIFTIINILRMLIILFIAFSYGQKSFFWTHDIFGNTLLILSGLGIFYIYIKKISS